MNKTPKKLFAIDAIGALISSIMLGVILTYIQPLIGLPKSILYKLSIVALVLFTYSSLCFIFIKHSFSPFLITIGIANLCYCIASVYLITIHFEELTLLGVTYFILEKVIVLTLAYIEIKTALK